MNPARPPQDRVSYYFKPPREIDSPTLEAVRDLVEAGGAVGTSWTEENLRGAVLVAYAAREGRVVGCTILKRPKEDYRKKIEAATGLDLSGYLERGYTAVSEEFRGRGIADALIRGLIRRSSEYSVYVTIRMDNGPALRLTEKNGMQPAARFRNPRTGRLLGLFVNRRPPPLPASSGSPGRGGGAF